MRKGRPPILASGPFLCLLLLACGGSTSPSAEETEQLDNAEAMLNAAPGELSDIEAGELEPDGNGPAARP